MPGSFFQQPGGGGAGAGGGGGAAALPAYIEMPYWQPLAHAQGDIVRWGSGVYRALKDIAAGGQNPGAFAPGLAASRQAAVMEVLKDPITRLYHQGAPWSDIDFNGAYAIRVVTNAACVLSITNRADNPVNRSLSGNLYDTADNFQNAWVGGSSAARGQTMTANLSANSTYNLILISNGDVAFDVSVDDPTKLNGADWECLTPGAPSVARWRSADVAVTSAFTVVCDQNENDMAGSYDGGSGTWTCPAGGWWRLEAFLHMTGMTAAGKSYAWFAPVNTGTYEALDYNREKKRFAAAAADSSGEVVLAGSVTVRVARGQQWRTKIEPGAGTPSLKGAGVHYQSPGEDAARFKATFVAPIW